ncbi:autotransporter-associated beta strand repeat-containing protein, partial [Bradyrhizobium sp. AUGA SZCCT0160]|uniref:autotransporter-associated beta strand repeat-containing protein n=1 Tax=Bradyrhizobium sp. AUGA SZCCT0160 TaxID=2807662 RepID=UPI0020117CB5
MAKESRLGAGSVTRSAKAETSDSQRRRHRQISIAIAVTICLAAPAKAQDATWLAAPGSSDYNTSTNWNPNTVPTGIAFFGASNITSLTISANTSVDAWTFNAGAPAYSFTNTQTLTFDDAGIVNGGAATITNNAGAFIRFSDFSTAGTATFINNGETRFFDSSKGGNASIINNNFLSFQTQSSAGNAVITNNGLLEFAVRGTGGNAAVTNSAVAVVDFSDSLGPANDGALAIGSLAGGGEYYLGARRVTVGGNNLSTTVTGVISDCGASGVACGDPGATGGQLIKTGTGTLNLAGNNIYTGNTTIDAGTLLVNGSIASSALTTVNAGATLGGTGTVGNLTIAGGTLAPGNSIGTLSVQGSLVFTAASTYLVEVSPTNSDLTNVTGSATLGGATVSAIYANAAYVARRYTIVNAAGGVNGTFGSVAN